jgi:hypothetical protein
MKRIGVLAVIFVLIHSVNGQELSATIAFEERVYNFGTIEEAKGKVSHTFIFQNKGKTPVTISDVNSGCGCIGKVVTKDPVQPGTKGKVTIVFDPSYKPGFFSKEVVVLSNNGEYYNRIWVEGVVKPAEHPIEDDYPYNFGEGLYLRLKVMAFGYLKPGETRQMELHYANGTNKEMLLNFAVDGSKGGLKFTNPGKIGTKAKGVVSFSYTMPQLSNNDQVFHLYTFVNNKKLTDTLEIKILNGNKRNQKDSQSKGTDSNEPVNGKRGWHW